MTSTQPAPLAPVYYLVHDTPAGTRYAYPLALLGLAKRPYNSAPWQTDNLTVSQPSGTRMEMRGDYLIADAPIVEVRAERPGERVRDGMEKRSEPAVDGPVSPELTAAFAAAPDRPTSEAEAHYAEHDAEHACWECRVFSATYTARYVQGDPIVTTHAFTHWLPLPGDLDPDPTRKWSVDDPSLLTIYGAHTAHLWPGVLAGLRAPVIERLKAEPLVSVQVWTHQTKVDVTIRVPWETPRTKVDHYKPYGKRKSVQRTLPVYAIEKRIEAEILDGLRAKSKAEAIASFDEVVTQQVGRILPYGVNPRGCDHCHGLGWVAGDA